MSFLRDRQIKGFFAFFIALTLLMAGAGVLVGRNHAEAAKKTYLLHDRAIASALLEQNVPKTVIASALTNQEVSAEGQELVSYLGVEGREDIRLLFPILVWEAAFISALFLGMFIFLRKRKVLYSQAEKALHGYINGDYSCHLPQNSEGDIFQIFASIEQLATMLQAKNETEHKAKEFLKSSISDISHQLKTPLAALTMYQEIIENEPDHADTVKEFSGKMGTSLKRMEQLIQAMLKITRLDAGSIVFEKRRCLVNEIVADAVSELTTRARLEGKQIIADGDPGQMISCDRGWTSEAIGNLVKNALDHTGTGGVIHITWENTPAMSRILVSDDGSGIAPEDIHHIFKRFYRSKYSLDTPGIGLGLPLAKSIVEGQGGVISVQSNLGQGTTFTLSFLTEL